MNNPRLWILILAGLTFLGGLALGDLNARRRQAAAEPRWAMSDYENMFGRRFDLSSERQDLLGSVLRSYQADIELLQTRHMAAHHASIEPELLKLGQRYNNLVRDHVLPPAQRPEFDRLCIALPLEPSN
ncbi:MAG: hypothetical protein QF724_05020 [Planctomycetota bacterium]|nr:hypothetical protein [Planctomycetota bacterium]MDP6520495.1 hypothetical protein [Planctomycetota bacterium]MDP6838280.1 hypothetical protein [Planctomycetota bacterium]